MRASPAPRGRGLKLAGDRGVYQDALVSPAPRGRGLKRAMGLAGRQGHESPAPRGRGLKRDVPYGVVCRADRRPPRAGVD